MVSGATVWKASEPAHELGAVEAAVAVADQLDRERVDAGVPGLLPRGELGQLAVVAAREVLADVPDLGGDEVVVVEEPLRRGGDELAAVHVAGERAVRLAQHADVVVEAREDAPRRAPRRVHREPGRERAGALVEPLDAEQLVAERLLGDRRARRARRRRTPSRASSPRARTFRTEVSVIGAMRWAGVAPVIAGAARRRPAAGRAGRLAGAGAAGSRIDVARAGRADAPRSRRRGAASAGARAGVYMKGSVGEAAGPPTPAVSDTADSRATPSCHDEPPARPTGARCATGARPRRRRSERAEHERSRERNAGAARLAGPRQGGRARAEGRSRLLRGERRALRDEAAAADVPAAPHPVREHERLALRPVRLLARREDRPVWPRRLLALPRRRRRSLPRAVPAGRSRIRSTSATAPTSPGASTAGGARTRSTRRRSGEARGSGSSPRATSAGSSSAPSGWSGTSARCTDSEKASFEDALKNLEAARGFFAALFELLAAPAPEQSRFEALAAAVAALAPGAAPESAAGRS